MSVKSHRDAIKAAARAAYIYEKTLEPGETPYGVAMYWDDTSDSVAWKSAKIRAMNEAILTYEEKIGS